MEKPMNLKRATLIALAACLLPFSAFAGDNGFDISEFRIEVSKDFDDNNTASVDVNLECDDGFVSQGGEATISEGSPHVFVVTEADYGVTCRVTEGMTAKYDATYTANGTEVDDGECLFVSTAPSAPAAAGGKSGLQDDHAAQIEFENTCEILNEAEPGKFQITKSWDVSGVDSVVDTKITLVIDCDAEVSGAQPVDCNEAGVDNTQCIWRDVDFGTATATASVMVDTSGGTASCTGTELNNSSTVEQTFSNCQSVSVSAAETETCSITNTVFFEGIPTLSQYGLAIMALLMLGVGFVGFRRFV
jgi:hypothetical protein